MCHRHRHVMTSVFGLSLTEHFPRVAVTTHLFVFEVVVFVLHLCIVILDNLIAVRTAPIVTGCVPLHYIVSFTVFISVMVVTDLLFDGHDMADLISLG